MPSTDAGTDVRNSQGAHFVEDRVVAVFKDDDQKTLRNRRLDDPDPDEDGSTAAPVRDAGDERRQAQRDLDRSIYIEAWRRLGAVTQIVTPPDGRPTFHSRLTHSQKVAQVSRSIAANILSMAVKDNSGTLRTALANLGGYDQDVCEAAGLLHDIGHPPFGHVGEETLMRFAEEVLLLPDGFEGNAQTIRVLTTQKLISDWHEGADLTAAVIAAVAKYPWLRPDRNDSNGAASDEETHRGTVVRPFEKERERLRAGREWIGSNFDVPLRPKISVPFDRDFEREKYSFYDAEAPILGWCRGFSAVTERRQTLEAATMDTADDITYAVHDLEDFLYAGRLDLGEIIHELEWFVGLTAMGRLSELKASGSPYPDLQKRLGKYGGKYSSGEFVNAARRLVGPGGFLAELATNGSSTTSQGSRRRLFSHKIGELINEVKFQTTEHWSNGPYIALNASAWHEVQILKSITRRHIINRSDIALLQRGQQQILWAVCEDLTAWVFQDFERLPGLLSGELTTLKAQRESPLENIGRGQKDADRGSAGRLLLDYICTLSDNQCVALYRKLRGAEVHKGGIAEVF